MTFTLLISGTLTALFVYKGDGWNFIRVPVFDRGVKAVQVISISTYLSMNFSKANSFSALLTSVFKIFPGVAAV